MAGHRYAPTGAAIQVVQSVSWVAVIAFLARPGGPWHALVVVVALALAVPAPAPAPAMLVLAVPTLVGSDGARTAGAAVQGASGAFAASNAADQAREGDAAAVLAWPPHVLAWALAAALPVARTRDGRTDARRRRAARSAPGRAGTMGP